MFLVWLGWPRCLLLRMRFVVLFWGSGCWGLVVGGGRVVWWMVGLRIGVVLSFVVSVVFGLVSVLSSDCVLLTKWYGEISLFCHLMLFCLHFGVWGRHWGHHWIYNMGQLVGSSRLVSRYSTMPGLDTTLVSPFPIITPWASSPVMSSV